MSKKKNKSCSQAPKRKGLPLPRPNLSKEESEELNDFLADIEKLRQEYRQEEETNRLEPIPKQLKGTLQN